MASVVIFLHLDTGNIEKYKDRNFCWYLGHQDGEMGRCNSPEVFANFFGLLDSLSHNGSKSNSSHSFGYKTDFRYHFHYLSNFLNTFLAYFLNTFLAYVDNCFLKYRFFGLIPY